MACKMCGGGGLYPFCEVCHESIDFTIRRAVQKNKKEVKRKDYEDEKLAAIERYREREVDKHVKLMVKNLLRVHGILSLNTATPEQIKDIFGDLGEYTLVLQMHTEAMEK